MNRHQPGVRVDAVEIDPAVVAIADRYFGVRSTENVQIITADAFDFLAKTEAKYDVIYMDAFLKPSGGTDGTGAPLRLRTLRFYEQIQGKLKPEGLVVFNLNWHRRVGDDVRTIRDGFPQTYVFSLPRQGGYVVFASLSPQPMAKSEG
jgi:spermidine synthase